MEKTIEQLKEKYDLDLNRIVNEIKKSKAKLILLQFPDGLKPYATNVVDYLKNKTKAEFIIWLGSCYGACDLPVGLERIKPKINLIVQFGHSELLPSY